MTNNRYILRSTSHSPDHGEKRLLNDQGLIVLLEGAKYVRRNNTDRVRYSDLKRLCNKKLAYLTENRETDFGGKFENYIVKFASESEPANRFLVRDKIRRKESYIIPNVEKIERLFVKYNISNLLDEELVPYKIKGPLPESKYTKERVSVTLGSGLILPGNPNGDESAEPPKLYSVCYFYENGNPVFVKSRDFHTNEEDPMPFYEDNSQYRSIFFGDRSIIQTYPA